MSARKLARDFCVAKQPLFRHLLAPRWVSAGVTTTLRLTRANGFVDRQEFSIFSEISKKFKGELERNPDFQQSVKDLKEDWNQKAEGFKGVREGLEARTKQTTEQLYKLADSVRVDAEATAKKVEDSFGFMKKESTEFTGASDNLHSNGKAGGKHTFAEGKQQEQQQHQQSGSGGNAETLFGKVKSGVSFLSSRVLMTFEKVREAKPIDIVKKGYNIIKDELKGNAGKRKHFEYPSPTSRSQVNVETSSATDIVVPPSKRSYFGRQWDGYKEKMRESDLYKKVSGMTKPIQEFADDVREIVAESEHPVIIKYHEVRDTVFGETDAAISLKEIRERDPDFSVPEFVAELQELIKPVLTAYFKRDIEILTKYCSPEVIERCKAEHKAFESLDMFFYNKILHISEVDVRETKMMGDTPIIIVMFQTQQIHCVRDRHGVVKDGGKDTIHTVYYAWAMQQIPASEHGEGAYPPTWWLREMQQFGVQALI